jgi:deoxyribonuclease V
VLACVDVDYRDKPGQSGGAVAACAVFGNWREGVPTASFVERIAQVEPYEPGAFYKRELPCLLQVLVKAHTMIQPQKLEMVLVDGYVSLGPSHPGLGARLYEALGGKIAVVGVAKTRFEGADAAEVLRGDSKSPLYVTTAGLDREVGAKLIELMHGPFRLPTLLKYVDRLCRDA